MHPHAVEQPSEGLHNPAPAPACGPPHRPDGREALWEHLHRRFVVDEAARAARGCEDFQRFLRGDPR